MRAGQRWAPLSILVAVVGLGAVWAAADEFVNVSVLDSNSSTVELQVDLTTFTHTSDTINGQRYLNLALPHEPVTLEAGAPAVPFVSRAVAVPPGSLPTVRVIDARYYDLPGVLVAPSKGNLTRAIDPATVPYTFGPAYATDTFYPGTLAEVQQPYQLRDVHGVAVHVYPLQYNPVSGTLRVYTSITVAVDTNRVIGGVAFRNAPPKPSRAFEQLYQDHFINYDALGRYAPLDETGNMLIICHDAWIPNITPLADHKNGIGIPTTVVGVSTIGNTSTAIKNYIQNVYNTSDLAFVLLVGDSTQVATPSASGGSSDPSYAKLAGGDNYPDIIVGRFSAETAAQVDIQVQRTLAYEQNQATLQSWFWKGVGVASSQGAGIGDQGQADYVHMDEIRTWLLARGYTTVNQIYDTNGGTAAMISAAVNEGRGIINYCGHGSTTAWSTTGFSNTNVNALTNTAAWPFIVSVACVNGQFAGYTCFAEAWLRANAGGQPTGAIGMYASSVNQSWAPPMEGQDEFNLLRCNVNEPYHCFGALCYAGSCSMMDAYGADGVEMYDTWHIFGDPSVVVIGTAQPPTGLQVSPGSAFNMSGPTGGPFTPGTMTYTLTNLNATPLQYQVTRTKNWLNVTNQTGTLPGGGSVTVTVSVNSAAIYLGNGVYSDTLTFANLTDGDGSTTRAVSLTVGAPSQVVMYNLDTNPGWTTQGQWAFGKPMGGGGAHGLADPTSGYTGLNVYGVNLNGDYSTASGGPYYLTAGPVNLSNVTDVSLRFMRWLNSDYEPYVTNRIEVSRNGTTWNTIWTQGGSEMTSSTWTAESYNVAAHLDNAATAYVRWSYQVGSGAWAYSGWNIDDVAFWGLQATNAPVPCAGDMNCDGLVDFKDINPFIEALSYSGGFDWPSTCAWVHGDCNGDGDVRFNDINPFVERLGTTCSE